MVIPLREDLRLEILKHISDNVIHNLKEISEYLAIEKFHLTDIERTRKMQDGNTKVFNHRIRWAIEDLKTTGLIEKAKNQKAVYKITKLGLEVLEKNPLKIDSEFLSSFPKYSTWKNPTKNIKKKKTDYTKGIVVLLDALGTKGKWKTGLEPAEISKSWNNLLNEFKSSINAEFKKENYEINFLTLSDTIMITVKTYDDIKTPLLKLAAALFFPFIRSMISKNPIRGCIAIGHFHIDNPSIIGQAIDEASEYHELPQWIGISASPKANIEIEKIYLDNPAEIKNFFFKCDIPLKKSLEQDAWALKWPIYSDNIISTTSTNYKNTRDLLNNNLKNAHPIDASLKWRNTIKFFELVIKTP